MTKRDMQAQRLVQWEEIDPDEAPEMIAVGPDGALHVQPLAIAWDEKAEGNVLVYALQTQYIRGIVPVPGLIVIPQALGCGHFTCSQPLDVCLN